MQINGLKKAVAIATLVSISLGILMGAVGVVIALDTRMDSKIERSVKPIADDVREIRGLLEKMLLRRGP